MEDVIRMSTWMVIISQYTWSWIVVYVATSWSSYNRRNMEVTSDEEEDEGEDKIYLEPPSSKIPEF